MPSVFDVIAHEDSDSFRNTRRATVAARARVEDTYGAWIRQDPVARLAHVSDEIVAIATQTANEHGATDATAEAQKIAQAILASYHPPVQSRTASIEVESGRMPRMCPFHKNVTEISLNSGDPASGFNAMAQHWGGPRHCEGDGYEGDSCKFKPQMTTQTYWDERTEKMEQRKKERAEREEQEAVLQAEQAEAEREFAEPLEQETEIPDNVVELHPEPVAESTEVSETSASEGEVPMSMAASARVALSSQEVMDLAAAATPIAAIAGYYGAAVAEKVADLREERRIKKNTKTADKDTTGLGEPVPKMDKSKWSPKERPDTDDPDGRNPTEHQDIVEPVKADNKKWPPEGIGKQVTERQDVTQDSGVTKIDQGGTFTGGPKSAISAVDVDRNPIIDMMNGDYDGFTPEADVQRAIVAHKRQV